MISRDESGETGFFEQVAYVIARNRIAAQPDCDSRVKKLLERSISVTEFCVRFRAVSDLGSVRLDFAYIAVGDGDTVCEQRAGRKHAEAFEIFDRRTVRAVPL